jgi:hypothetical protein
MKKSKTLSKEINNKIKVNNDLSSKSEIIVNEGIYNCVINEDENLEDADVEYDFWIDMPPKKSYEIKVHIKKDNQKKFK